MTASKTQFLNWFSGCFDMDSLRTRYRELAKKHHPDLGGDRATMQSINAEYEDRLQGNYDRKYDDPGKRADFMNMEREAMEIVGQIIGLQNVTIELIGRWIWITGDTKPIKEHLKQVGFRFCRKKTAWYWRSKKEKFFKTGRRKSMDEIRAKYGSEQIRTHDRERLHAAA